MNDTQTGYKHVLEHIHYFAWPDMQVPKEEALPDLIKVVEKVCGFLESTNSKYENADLPPKLLVHCKMGLGRTGTAIALINAVICLRHQIEEHRQLSVFSIVRRIREQRSNSVQSQKQYDFIFKFLRRYLNVTTKANLPETFVKKGPCNYRFQDLPVGSINYRVPVLNFNAKPFNGEKFNDQALKRAQAWAGVGTAESDQQDAAERQLKRRDYSESNFTHIISIPVALDNIDAA